MTSIFRHVALIGKYHASLSGGQSGAMRRVLEDVAEFLTAQGCDVMVEQETANNTGLGGYPLVKVPEIGARCDLGLVVGGDGTMLGIGRQLAPFAVPLIGINQGRLGFITDISLERFRLTLAPMLRGDYVEDRRSLMHASVMRDGHCVFDALAMNDVVVNRGTTASLVDLEISLNERFAYGFRADGVIVATPTGSTAYALSAGGPILAPTVNAFTLAPIAPHALTMRPIVVADDSVIRITVARAREAVASIDGHHSMPLAEGDSVLLRRARTNVRLWHPLEYDYYHTLRHKLGWTETPEGLSPRKR